LWNLDIVIVSYSFLKNPYFFYCCATGKKPTPKFELISSRKKTVATARKVQHPKQPPGLTQHPATIPQLGRFTLSGRLSHRTPTRTKTT
jgi:hypothetical protein